MRSSPAQDLAGLTVGGSLLRDFRGHRQLVAFDPYATWARSDSPNEIYGIFRRPPEFVESIRPSAGKLDDLAPLLGFVGDELSKIAGEPATPNTAQRRGKLGTRRCGVQSPVTWWGRLGPPPSGPSQRCRTSTALRSTARSSMRFMVPRELIVIKRLATNVCSNE